MNPYLEMIKNRIPVIYDGATGTQIQKSGVSPECFQGTLSCNEILNLTCPDIIQAIHESYLSAGANVVETNTFGGSRPKLNEYGLGDRVHEINRAGALAARNAVENRKNNSTLFVCGGMGPTGFLPSSKDESLSAVSFEELVSIFEEQAWGLLDGGVDLLLIETSQDLLEVRAAINGIRRVFTKKGITVPVQVQVTVDATGKMLLGSNVRSFLGAVAPLSPSVLGFNCGTGPHEIHSTIKELLRFSPYPVSLLPNAGIPKNIDGKAVYEMSPAEFADAIVPLVIEDGLEVVGGCCGTSPDHIAELSKKLRGKNAGSRKRISKANCWLSTGLDGVDIEDIRRPVIIGERLNAQGSRKTKELMIADDYDELFQIALEQQKAGSSLLDLSVAINERDDETGMIKRLVRFMSDRIEIPFCIDSTEPEVMKVALQLNPGSMMLNSINLELGGSKAEKILGLARDFGCPVIALTIDDEGMARTVGRKLDVARRLRKLACNKYGLPGHYLYIDPLVFTLATGDPLSADAALLSLEAIKRIKQEMPDIRTVMGVSNVSFGFKPKARRILNNLMLHHAVKAGLDAAIFNPLHLDDSEKYDSQVRQCAEDLLFNKKPDALSLFVNYFEAAPLNTEKKELPGIQKNLAPEEKLHNSIVNRDRRGLREIIEELLKTTTAHDILNTILLPAMGEVGEKMSSGEMILPFVLQAAEVMKEAVSVLEEYLKGESSSVKGKLVLATVYGDVHDIGKNLVASILSNQGFDVLDLGKQVKLETIIETVKKEKPLAVGLSALLVTTSREMARCAVAFEKEGISVPILIGGAAVNREFASRINILPDGKRYSGGVYYAKDAFGASKLLDELSSGGGVISEDKHFEKNKKGDKSSSCSDSASQLEYGPHLEPPLWGTSEILVWDQSTLLNAINKERLFKAGWSGGKLNPDDYAETVKNQFEPAFKKLSEEILDTNLLDARGFYGFFPVITDKDNLIMIDPGDFHTELAEFRFPRVSGKKCRSLADYFNPDGDLIGIQVVTIGKKLSDRCREYFQKEDRYSYGFYLNALGNMLVENLAERLTTEIRRALGLEAGTGKRYSFGYPGMPSLEEQKTLFGLIGVEERLGIKLTPGFQMDPEHSTLGIYVHYPMAEYLG